MPFEETFTLRAVAFELFLNGLDFVTVAPSLLDANFLFLVHHVPPLIFAVMFTQMPNFGHYAHLHVAKDTKFGIGAAIILVRQVHSSTPSRMLHYVETTRSPYSAIAQFPLLLVPRLWKYQTRF